MSSRFERADLERMRIDSEKRAQWIEDDPAKLFRLLALDETTDEEKDEFGRRLELALDAPRPSAASVGPAGTSRWGWVAAAAAIVLAVWAGSTYLPGGNPKLDSTSELASADPKPGPISLPELEPIQPTAFRDDSLQGVEVLATPGEARVVDLSVGETRVVMIFDKEMDL